MYARGRGLSIERHVGASSDAAAAACSQATQAPRPAHKHAPRIRRAPQPRDKGAARRAGTAALPAPRQARRRRRRHRQRQSRRLRIPARRGLQGERVPAAAGDARRHARRSAAREGLARCAPTAGRARVEQVLERGVTRVSRHRGSAGPQRLGERRRPAPAAALRGRPGRTCTVRAPATGSSPASRATPAPRRRRRRSSRSAWIRTGRWSSPPSRRSRASTCRTSSRPRRCARRRPSASTWIRARPQARVDLRALPLVTIDGEDARDFDDAVYAEHARRAFASSWRSRTSATTCARARALDAEAQERGTSVYFPTRVLPMLPTALSDHLCSLAPHVDRLCFAADMVVSKSGALKSATFYPAVMRSAARLTYTLAHEALFEGRPAARAQLGPLLRQARWCWWTSTARCTRRAAAAARWTSTPPEAEFVIDAGRARARDRAARSQRCASPHRGVHDPRQRRGRPGAGARRTCRRLYRVHGQPEDEKLERLDRDAARRSASMRSIPKSVTTRDLQAIARRVRGCARARLRRVAGGARHAAGGLPADQHRALRPRAARTTRTSPRPIRRYPDLVVHRTLKALIGAKGGAAVRYELPSSGALGREHLAAGEARGRGRPLRVQLPQVHLPARAHRPDLPGAHHDGGGVRLLRADPRRRRSMACCTSTTCATMST